MYTCKCGTIFTQTKHNQIYCSKKCKYKFKRLKVLANKNKNNFCIVCNTNTYNPKYCSKKCYLSINKISSPKLKDVFCKKCNTFLRNGSTLSQIKICNNCNPNYVDWSKITKIEMRNKYKNSLQYHSRLRSLARKKCKDNTCKICGYTLHIEVCHIRPISDFPDTALVSEINDMSNLVALCPNCHWEYDNGLIKL
jgi:5-methylcytosine-specific restriction endonuclease McrA